MSRQDDIRTNTGTTATNTTSTATSTGTTATQTTAIAVDVAAQTAALTKGTVTLFASAARTATANSSDASNDPQEKGVKLFLDITAVSGTNPTLNVKLQFKDPVSAKYEDMAGAAFAEKTATGQGVLTIYPGVAETANVSVSDILGSTWRIVATIGGTDTPTFTYSLSGDYL